MNQATFAYPGLSGNDVLARLDYEARARLPYLFKLVNLDAQQTLSTPGDEMRHVYFPVTCVAAMVSVMDDGATVETAMMGRDGVVGLNAVVGHSRSSHWTKVFLPGEALRAEAGVVQELFYECPKWQQLLLRYYSTLINQVSRRAICNTRHRLNERLCTWLLMVHDRARRDDLPMTQECVARQLGVRRAGVNEVIGLLERLSVLDHSRGHIRIMHRDALEDAACACYPAFKQEARWLENVPEQGETSRK